MLTYPNQTAASTRELAWNAVGSVTEERLVNEPMDATTLLREAGLADWNVRAVPLATAIGEHSSALDDMGIRISDQFANVGTINGEPKALGIVGKRYAIVQNEGLTAFGDTVVDEGGAHFVAGGATRSNRSVFMVMKMPTSILIGGEDAHDLYLGATNHHDGNGSLVVWVTTMRLRCTNMLNAAMRGAKSKWSLRHTSGIHGRAQEARESLGLTFKWVESFERQAEKMLLTPMSGDAFDAAVDALAPPSDSKLEGWQRRANEKRATLRHLFHEAETNEFGRGTQWAAYNAFTEYADWYLPVRDKAPTARAARTLDGGVDNFKQDAFDLLVGA